MRQFNYNPTITDNIIKTANEQFDKFFYQGHPLFLIPDFNKEPGDIWLSYLDFLEKSYSCEIYDQDGGEITLHKIIDTESGLTKCVYTAYGVALDSSDEPQDIEVEIEGYVTDSINGYIFVATKVIENYMFVL